MSILNWICVTARPAKISPNRQFTVAKCTDRHLNHVTTKPHSRPLNTTVTCFAFIFNFFDFSNFVFNRPFEVLSADVTHSALSTNIVSNLNRKKCGEFGQQMRDIDRSRQSSSLIRFRVSIVTKFAGNAHRGVGTWPIITIMDTWGQHNFWLNANWIVRRPTVTGGAVTGLRVSYLFMFCLRLSPKPSTHGENAVTPRLPRVFGLGSARCRRCQFHNLFLFQFLFFVFVHRNASVNKKSYNWNRCPACATQSPKHQNPTQFIAYLCAFSRAQCQLPGHWLRLFCPRRRRRGGWGEGEEWGDQVVIRMQTKYTINKKMKCNRTSQ